MKFAAAALLATVVAAGAPLRGRGYGRRHPSLSRGYGYGTKSLGGHGRILPMQKGLRPISRGLSPLGGRSISDLSSVGKLDRGLGLRELDGLSLSSRGSLKGLSPKRGYSPLSRSRSPLPLQRGLVGEIIKRFEAKGYKLVAMKLASSRKEHMEKHYEDLSAKKFFNVIHTFCNLIIALSISM